MCSRVPKLEGSGGMLLQENFEIYYSATSIIWTSWRPENALPHMRRVRASDLLWVWSHIE